MENMPTRAHARGQRPRRLREQVLGWFHLNLDPPVPEPSASIRQLVFSLVTLNVSTLKALEDGWYGSPQIIDRCCDEYRGFLRQGEAELQDWLNEDGGSRFESRVSEYVNQLSSEHVMDYLTDLRTSQFYGQLIDISHKKYRAAQAHATLISRPGSEHTAIPEEFNYCVSYQSYVEHVASAVIEARNFLRKALSRAKQLLQSIKVAADDRSLSDAHLVALKVKVSALQEYFPDAWAAIYGPSSDLFDPTHDHWWETTPSTRALLPGYQLPTNEARAYDVGARSVPLLNFFVPTMCLVSCIPMGFAWRYSDQQKGTPNDRDFYQLIAGSILQVLGLATLVYPTIFHNRLARYSWLLTWMLVSISAACTIASIPLYLLAPTAWSMVVAFGGVVAQALVILQIVPTL